MVLVDHYALLAYSSPCAVLQLRLATGLLAYTIGSPNRPHYILDALLGVTDVTEVGVGCPLLSLGHNMRRRVRSPAVMIRSIR